MNKQLQGALVANAASMGFNWIYNIPYLERLAKEQDLIFQPVDAAKYKRARKAVLAYPAANVGDVSLQGEILRWLYQALKENPDLTKENYETLVYEHIKPGGDYYGWIESYGKKLVYSRLIDDLKTEDTYPEMNDNQLIGFIPYFATKALDLPNEKAWELAQAFTDNEDYKAFYDVFDFIIEEAKKTSLNEALKASLVKIPMQFGFKCTMALNMETPKDMLKIVETSCAIGYALPLTFTILQHTNSFEEAIKLNTQFGGASCDRGTLIGFLLAALETVPSDYIEKTNL